MTAHAILSASARHRWLSCPPSARLCADKEDTASEYVLQGTDAHTLCEYKLKKEIGMKTRNPIKSLSYYDEEMEQCAEEYATFCSSVVEEVKQTCKDPVVRIEQKLDFSQYVPEEFGTGDCVIIGDGTLHVIDYKHGKGVEVLADNNPQMMCYVLGALNLFDGIYDIDKVSMTIFQPRRENVSTFEMKKEDLYSWAETVLAPTAKLAFDGEGEFKAGSHCQFCKVKAICRKRMEYNMEMAKYDFEMPATLEEAEIAVILTKADERVAWAMDVKEYALQQAVSGTHYDGFKVVEGRSNRKYTDEDAVAEVVKNAGKDPYEKKLLGITAMTSVLDKKKFEELLGAYVYKPQGKLTLVPESDKRPAINTAKEDFSEN